MNSKWVIYSRRNNGSYIKNDHEGEYIYTQNVDEAMEFPNRKYAFDYCCMVIGNNDLTAEPVEVTD